MTIFLSTAAIGNIPHRHFLLIERVTAVCSLSSQFDDRATRKRREKTVSFCMKCYCMLYRPFVLLPSGELESSKRANLMVEMSNYYLWLCVR